MHANCLACSLTFKRRKATKYKKDYLLRTFREKPQDLRFFRLLLYRHTKERFVEKLYSRFMPFLAVTCLVVFAWQPCIKALVVM